MNQIRIMSKNRLFPVAEDLYGLFYEDINRAGDSGIYPEMLRNRSFEDSLVPEGCTLCEETGQFITPTGWVGEFHGGEGLSRWKEQWPPTEIPAWYSCGDVTMKVERHDTLNRVRKCSLSVEYRENQASIYNIGYDGIYAEAEKGMRLFLFAKSLSGEAAVRVALKTESGEILCEEELMLKEGEYQSVEVTLIPRGNCDRAYLHLIGNAGCSSRIGYISLMPEDTWKGHGLRKDIIEKLEGLHPRFMRYPGGCIVEGYTKANALRFSQLMGPVWERPSTFLLWFYRTTNGFGYREFLQLCEDMNMAAMYVINCGMTCQARKPDFFDPVEMEELYQECTDAIDYAIAPTETEMGSKRAADGHPAPYALKYIEIGNENRDEPYFKNYEWFYQRLKKRYPQLIFISNCHTETVGLPTEVVDEHYYSDLDFFVYHHDMYDGYDRKGPKIFVGEYAVTAGEYPSSLAAALGEGAFLTGIERNQDIVELTSYAPMLLNEKYMCWKPDLIVFNNHESYGIPSYYLQQMFAASRGTHVVQMETLSEQIFLEEPGQAGIWACGAGVQINRLAVNQHAVEAIQEVPALFQPVYPFQKNADGWESAAEGMSYGLLGTQKYDGACTVEAELSVRKGSSAGLSVGNRLIARGLSTEERLKLNYEGLVSYCWRIEGGTSAVYMVRREKTDQLCISVPLELDDGRHHWKMTWGDHGFTCSVDGNVIHEAVPAAQMPLITASATVDETDGDVIVKLVNISDEPQPVKVLTDIVVAPTINTLILTSDRKTDQNTMEEPEKVIPKAGTCDMTDGVYQAPANSVNILRIHTKS